MLLTLFGCQQSGRSEKPLRSTQIGSFMPSGEQKKLSVVQNNSGFSLFIEDARGKHEIGALTQQLPSVPAKTIFVEIEGVLFVVAVVDEQIQDARTVTVARPLSEPNDDTMNTMRAGDVKNGVSFIPIGNTKIDLWHSVASFLILSKQWEDAIKIDFEQPVTVDFVTYQTP